LKRVVLASLRLLSGIWPRAGIRAAHALAGVTGPLGFGIAPEWLASVFPELGPGALRATRRQTWATFLKGEALEGAIVRAGRRGYPRVALDPAFSAMAPPLILASMHIGPFQGIGAAVRLLPGEVMGLTRGQYLRPTDLTLVEGGEDEQRRAQAFGRALATLRRDGFVLITVDAFTPGEYEPSSIEVPMLGSTIRLARGAFALARITGTPVRPIASRWRGTRLEVCVGDPVASALGEEGMAAAVGGWFERYLRASPGEVSVFILERLRPAAPR
jgi:lauroyl/myristoyl acyltransferase